MKTRFKCSVCGNLCEATVLKEGVYHLAQRCPKCNHVTLIIPIVVGGKAYFPVTVGKVFSKS